MRIVNRFKAGLAFLLCFGLFGNRPVQAGFMEEVHLTTCDPENGYRYEWNRYGGFYTNVLLGENSEFAYFSIDETLHYRMFKDGEMISYTQDDLLLENGSYTLYLFPAEEEEKEEYCTFGFQIVSDYISVEGGRNYAPAEEISYSGMGVQEAEMSFLFDKEQEVIRFGADDRMILETNIPNGATVSTPVYLKAADGVTQTIYHNGEYIVCPENGIYKESGFYKCIQMVYPDAGSSMGEENPIIMTAFYFRIVDEKEMCINVIGAPEGFFLDRVLYQGEEQELPQISHYFMQGEGEYLFDFTSTEDEGLSYTLELTRDTTAPFLDFQQEIVNGKAAAPLFMISREASCSYEVVRNGVKYDYVQGEPLKTGGYYEVVVSDEYGNSRKYIFLLEADYVFFSPGMILLLSLLTIILLIVLYRSGHDLTVV